MYEILPTSAKYVIDDINQGKLDNAYYSLCTEVDKIRGSFLGETLKSFCINI